MNKMFTVYSDENIELTTDGRGYYEISIFEDGHYKMTFPIDTRDLSTEEVKGFV